MADGHHPSSDDKPAGSGACIVRRNRERRSALKPPATGSAEDKAVCDEV